MVKPTISQEANKISLQYFSAKPNNHIARTEWQQMIGLVPLNSD
jgi:hypothetical protein